MQRRINDFYSYLFQEEENVTAAYFQTRTGTEYRVYFYPTYEYFDNLDPETLLHRFGFFFGFTKMAPNEDKREPLDFQVRNTILIIINEFFEDKGKDKVLIFFCDDGDGKKTKRWLCFDSWYQLSDTHTCFRKFDEEIITTDLHGNKVDIDYMSLIVECENPQIENLLIEFQILKETMIGNKQ